MRDKSTILDALYLAKKRLSVAEWAVENTPKAEKIPRGAEETPYYVMVVNLNLSAEVRALEWILELEERSGLGYLYFKPEGILHSEDPK